MKTSFVHALRSFIRSFGTPIMFAITMAEAESEIADDAHQPAVLDSAEHLVDDVMDRAPLDAPAA
jgi:hypothetical protein